MWVRNVMAVALTAAVPVSGCSQGSATGGAGAAASSGISTLPPGLAGHPAPPIRLTDARGGTFDSTALRGRPYAVTFLYANCPDVCPLIAEELRQALARLGPAAGRVAVAAVSVDPRGDTRENVLAFLERHHEPASFHYLIGSKRELEPTWKAYYAAPEIHGDPDSSHSAVVWLVDRRGRLAGKFDAGTPLRPSEVAATFRRLASTD